ARTCRRVQVAMTTSLLWGPRRAPRPPALASAPVEPRRCSTSLIRPEDQVGLEVGDLGTATESHRDVQLIAQDLEDTRDALGAIGAETPEGRAPEHDHLRAAGQALDDVGALREPAVDHDLGTARDRIDDRWQRVDRRLRVIELAAAVVRDPDELHAHLGGAARVGHREDALE